MAKTFDYDLDALAKALGRILKDDSAFRTAINATRGVNSKDPPGSHTGTIKELSYILFQDDKYRATVRRPHSESELRSWLRSGDALRRLHSEYQLIVDVLGQRVNICRVGWKY